MSDKTPDILIPALRQYQHNDCSGLLAGFDYDETVKIVTNLQQQILDICQPQWIDVNERLPDKRGDYLAFSRSTGVAWMFFNTTRNTWTSGDDYITNVTHWMPLPLNPRTQHE